jgi:predicted RNA binding protein YcfA (HicA-like mRNA interferase family)
LLTGYGFELKRSGSSHFLYRRGKRSITVVRYGSQVHPDAVREMIAFIDELEDGE